MRPMQAKLNQAMGMPAENYGLEQFNSPGKVRIKVRMAKTAISPRQNYCVPMQNPPMQKPPWAHVETSASPYINCHHAETPMQLGSLLGLFAMCSTISIWFFTAWLITLLPSCLKAHFSVWRSLPTCPPPIPHTHIPSTLWLTPASTLIVHTASCKAPVPLSQILLWLIAQFAYCLSGPHACLTLQIKGAVGAHGRTRRKSAQVGMGFQPLSLSLSLSLPYGSRGSFRLLVCIHLHRAVGT